MAFEDRIDVARYVVKGAMTNVTAPGVYFTVMRRGMSIVRARSDQSNQEHSHDYSEVLEAECSELWYDQ